MSSGPSFRAGRRVFCAAALTSILIAPAALAATSTDAARAGASWLVKHQQSNGAFFSPLEQPDVTAVTVVGVVAGGGSAEAVKRALGYMKQDGGTDARSSALAAGRVVAGIVAGGGNPRSFGGVDYVQILGSFYDGVSGAYDTTNLESDLIAANGIVAAGSSIPKQAVKYIRSKQCRNGAALSGFAATDCSSGADVQTTAWAINVLRRASVKTSDGALVGARVFLSSAQNDDGGFGNHESDATMSHATGLAISAIYALRDDPTAKRWRTPGGNPVRALRALQDPSGGFLAEKTSAQPDETSTDFAVPGLAAKTYPVLPPPSAAPPGSTPSGGKTSPVTAPRATGAANAAGGSSSQVDNPDHLSSERTPLETARPCETCNRSIGSFSKPKTKYDDGTARTRIMALAGLGIAGTMLFAGYSLLRGSHAPS